MRFERNGEIFVWKPDTLPNWPFLLAILVEAFGLWWILFVWVL